VSASEYIPRNALCGLFRLVVLYTTNGDLSLRYARHHVIVRSHLLTIFLPCLTEPTHGPPSYYPVCAHVPARLPPTFGQPTNTTCKALPPGWNHGDWALTYSSKPIYHFLWNIQIHQNPLTNAQTPGQLADITSFGYSANDSHTYTVYGIDTPYSENPQYTGVYNFNATGTLSGTSDTFEILSWGYDTAGHGFMAFYEGQEANGGAAPALDIVSRSAKGPTDETLYAIYSALASLGNDYITALVRNVTATPNSRQAVVGPVACGEACMNNTNIVP